MSYGVRRQPYIPGPLDTYQKLQDYLNSCPPDLTELDLRSKQIKSLTRIHFPPGLKRLYLTDNNITSLSPYYNPYEPRPSNPLNIVFPPGLESLDLRKNKIHSLEGVVFPPSLKFLDLEENQIKSLKGVVFPSGLEGLHLYSNQINSLAGVMFPVGLKDLDLSNNKIESLILTQFPPNLETLDLDENPLYEVDGIINPNKYVMEYLKRNFSNLYFRDLYGRHKDEKSALKAAKQSKQATLKEISDFTQQSMQNQLRGITSFLRKDMEDRAEQHAEQIKKAIEEKGIPAIYIRLNGKIYPVPLNVNAAASVQYALDYMHQQYFVSSILPNCSIIRLYKTDGSHLEPERALADHNVQNKDILNIECHTLQFGGKRLQEIKNKNRKSKKRWSLKYKRSINCSQPRGFSQRQYCKYGRRTHKTSH
jgi:hypothetical protein